MSDSLQPQGLQCRLEWAKSVPAEPVQLVYVAHHQMWSLINVHWIFPSEKRCDRWFSLVWRCNLADVLAFCVCFCVCVCVCAKRQNSVVKSWVDVQISSYRPPVGSGSLVPRKWKGLSAGIPDKDRGSQFPGELCPLQPEIKHEPLEDTPHMWNKHPSAPAALSLSSSVSMRWLSNGIFLFSIWVLEHSLARFYHPPFFYVLFPRFASFKYKR